MGFYKAEKSMNPKESVGPAKMIVSSADAMEPFALAQDASKASSYPFIHDRKGWLVTVFEVSKPALQGAVDVFDDRGQTPAIAALGFGSNAILELPHTFWAGPAFAPLKMIAEKVKAFSGNTRIHQSGFIRVQSKSSFCGQPTEEIQGPAGFGLTAAQDHKVSSPGESHPQALSEPDVNLSAHPAPIIQPQAKSPSASGQRAGGRVSRFSPASIRPYADGDLASCISFEPTESVLGSYVA